MFEIHQGSFVSPLEQNIKCPSLSLCGLLDVNLNRNLVDSYRKLGKVGPFKILIFADIV